MPLAEHIELHYTTMGWLFKQSLAVVKQNHVLSLLSLAEPFIATFIFLSSCKSAESKIVEEHLFYYIDPLKKIPETHFLSKTAVGVELV